tara:strand:+ start:1586 stop:2215 length:630 start_codon:yes stop_codon:yes gene_type:complete
MTKRITKESIITELYNSEVIAGVVDNMTRGDALKGDLLGELFLILCEMKAERLKKAHREKYLVYMCINILKRQYNSSTSPFHTKYRKRKTSALEDTSETKTDEFTYEDNHEREDAVLAETNKFLDRLGVVDRELFKIYYKMGKYDRWIGENRDTTCTKSISSTRKIEKKLALKAIEGQKRVTIDHSTIANSIKKTLKALRKHLIKKGFE